jgi:hypothetical protein
MDKIYILKKDKLISGPYSLQYVKDKGMLRTTDMVWYEGLTDWTPVSQVDLFEGHIKEHVKTEKTFFDKVFGFLK